MSSQRSNTIGWFVAYLRNDGRVSVGSVPEGAHSANPALFGVEMAGKKTPFCSSILIG